MAYGSKTLTAQLQDVQKPAGTLPAIGVSFNVYQGGTVLVGTQNVTLVGGETSVSSTFSHLAEGSGYVAKIFAYDENSNPTAPAFEVGPFTVDPDVSIVVVSGGSA